MANIITSKEYRVKDLWRLLDERVFAVPEIQRGFVWDMKKAAKLLDSIYRGLPIGTMAVWRTGRANRNQLRHAQGVIPPYNDDNKYIWFLIDGQQRLSVLHRIRQGGQVVNYNKRELDFDQLCFSFDKNYEQKFLRMRPPQPKIHIPMPDILADSWRRRVGRLTAGKTRRIAELREIVAKYPLRVVFMESSSLDDVGETFVRINSAGLRVSTADILFTHAATLSLRHLVDQLLNKLPQEFSDVDRDTVLFTIALVRGVHDVGIRAVARKIEELNDVEIVKGKVSDHFTKQWRHIAESFKKAIDYLSSPEVGIPNLTFLPSSNILAMLAFFFYENNRAQPSAYQRRELKKWFWGTSLAGRYAGREYRESILSDIKFMRTLGRRKAGRFSLREKIPVNDLQREDYRSRSGLTTAYFLMLLRRQPLYLDTGGKFTLKPEASSANRKDKHHIFAKSLLESLNVPSRQIHSICNICFMVAEDNQSFGSKRPWEYLEDYRRKKHFARAMKSHLIPHGADDGLWEHDPKRGLRTMVAKRTEWIRRALEAEAGTKIFRKD